MKVGITWNYQPIHGMNKSQGRIQSTVALHLRPDTLPISPHCWGRGLFCWLLWYVLIDYWLILAESHQMIQEHPASKSDPQRCCVRLCLPHFSPHRAERMAEDGRLTSGTQQGRSSLPSCTHPTIFRCWKGAGMSGLACPRVVDGAQKSNPNGKHRIVLVKSKFTWNSPQFEERIANHNIPLFQRYHLKWSSSIWTSALPLGPKYLGPRPLMFPAGRPMHVSWPSMWRGKSPTKTWRRLRLNTFGDVPEGENCWKASTDIQAIGGVLSKMLVTCWTSSTYFWERVCFVN